MTSQWHPNVVREWSQNGSRNDLTCIPEWHQHGFRNNTILDSPRHQFAVSIYWLFNIISYISGIALNRFRDPFGFRSGSIWLPFRAPFWNRYRRMTDVWTMLSEENSKLRRNWLRFRIKIDSETNLIGLKNELVLNRGIIIPGSVFGWFRMHFHPIVVYILINPDTVFWMILEFISETSHGNHFDIILRDTIERHSGIIIYVMGIHSDVIPGYYQNAFWIYFVIIQGSKW